MRWKNDAKPKDSVLRVGKWVAVLAVMIFIACWDGTWDTVGGGEFDSERAAAIRHGTPAAQVQAALGPPLQRTPLPDGSEQWLYREIVERKSGVSVGVNIPTARHRRQSEARIVLRNGRVVSVAVTDKRL